MDFGRLSIALLKLVPNVKCVSAEGKSCAEIGPSKYILKSKGGVARREIKNRFVLQDTLWKS